MKLLCSILIFGVLAITNAQDSKDNSSGLKGKFLGIHGIDWDDIIKIYNLDKKAFKKEIYELQTNIKKHFKGYTEKEYDWIASNLLKGISITRESRSDLSDEELLNFKNLLRQSKNSTQYLGVIGAIALTQTPAGHDLLIDEVKELNDNSLLLTLLESINSHYINFPLSKNNKRLSALKKFPNHTWKNRNSLRVIEEKINSIDFKKEFISEKVARKKFNKIKLSLSTPSTLKRVPSSLEVQEKKEVVNINNLSSSKSKPEQEKVNDSSEKSILLYFLNFLILSLLGLYIYKKR